MSTGCAGQTSWMKNSTGDPVRWAAKLWAASASKLRKPRRESGPLHSLVTPSARRAALAQNYTCHEQKRCWTEGPGIAITDKVRAWIGRPISGRTISHGCASSSVSSTPASRLRLDSGLIGGAGSGEASVPQQQAESIRSVEACASETQAQHGPPSLSAANSAQQVASGRNDNGARTSCATENTRMAITRTTS